jgi:hypothetical protein
MNLGNKACNSQCRAPRSRIHGSACRTILRVTLAFLPMAAALGLDGGNSLVLTTPTGINTNWVSPPGPVLKAGIIRQIGMNDALSAAGP